MDLFDQTHHRGLATADLDPFDAEARDAQLLAVFPGHQDVAVGGELRGRVVEAEVDLHADAGIEFDAEDLDRIPASRAGRRKGA